MKKRARRGRRKKALAQEEPHRACVTCRTSSPQPTMLRFARAPDGLVAFDVRGRLPGRGAWVCAQPGCLTGACQKGAFGRAFEAPCVVEPGLVERVASLLTEEFLALLGLLRRQSAVAAGRDEALRVRSTARAVLVASDLSERSRREVDEGFAGVPVVEGPPMEAVGHAMGVRPVGVVALLPGALTDRLLQEANRLGGVLGRAVGTSSSPVASADEGR